MIEKNDKHVDSIGVWILYEDGFEIDNSMDLSVLEDLGKYGADDIKPIQEFFKMTIQEYEGQES